MHELVLAQQIVTTVMAEVKRRHARSVKSIAVELGGLEGVTEDQLRHCFEIQAAGTPLEGSTLMVRVTATTAHCPACGLKLPMALVPEPSHGVVEPLCPECDTVLEVQGTRGLEVLRATLDLPGP